MKILLAVDGSDYTKRMLAYLAAHDELLGPENEFNALVVIPPIPVAVPPFVSKDILDSYFAEQADSILRPVMAFARQQKWDIHRQFIVGDPAASIAKVADEDGFDMVVMGSHGHTALRSLAMGSVVSGVMARCRAPVLVIK